jgi:caa(3)-type oxidase subunit IV
MRPIPRAAGLSVCIAQYVDFNVIVGVPNVNLVVAMAVALTKALLVCLFFMHLKDDNKIFALTFGSSVIFLGIFFLLTMADLFTRGIVDDKQGTFEKDHRIEIVAPKPPAGWQP